MDESNVIFTDSDNVLDWLKTVGRPCIPTMSVGLGHTILVKQEDSDLLVCQDRHLLQKVTNNIKRILAGGSGATIAQHLPPQQATIAIIAISEKTTHHESANFSTGKHASLEKEGIVLEVRSTDAKTWTIKMATSARGSQCLVQSDVIAPLVVTYDTELVDELFRSYLVGMHVVILNVSVSVSNTGSASGENETTQASMICRHMPPIPALLAPLHDQLRMLSDWDSDKPVYPVAKEVKELCPELWDAMKSCMDGESMQ
jgi:hypothetical protein